MADQPNYTRVPNALLDSMPKLGNAELRVALAIARKTVGYQKECDRISARQLATMTGLTLRNTHAAIRSLVTKGVIEQEPAGKQSFCYSLKTVSLVDTDQNRIPSDTGTLGDTVLLPVGIQLDEKLYPLGYQQKKDIKETNKRKDRAPRKRADAPTDKTDHQKVMDAYTEVLGYPIKDGAKEGNAAKWLVQHGYTPEQVSGCYTHLKAQAFWKPKHVSLQTVAGNIGAYVQSQNGHTNGLLRSNAGQNPERAKWTAADLDEPL